MASVGTIPVMKKPVSSMETGPNGVNLEASSKARHPVDILQQQTAGAHPYRSINFARHVYGSGLAMVLATEQKIANQERQQRNIVGLSRGGLSGSTYGDIVTGQDVNIDFSDYLSIPDHRPDISKQNPQK